MATADDVWKMVVRPAPPVAYMPPGTSRSVAPVRGAKQSPADAPISRPPIRRWPSAGSAPRANRYQTVPAAPAAAPAITMGALPIRSASLPAWGEMAKLRNGPGAMASPVCTTDHPHLSCTKLGSSTIIEKKAVQNRKELALPTVQDRSRNRRSGNSGSGWRRLRTAKAAISAAPAPNAARVAADPQPQAPPWSIPNRMAPIPSEASGTLTASTRRATMSPVLSTRMRRPTIMAAAATGMLTRNTDRHPNPAMSRPPRLGPRAAASPPMAPHTPMANWCRDRGKAARVRASPAGNSKAPPTDCTTRAAISIPMPAAAPDPTEPAMKAARPTRNARRRPWRSASQPATSSRAPTPRL